MMSIIALLLTFLHVNYFSSVYAVTWLPTTLYVVPYSSKFNEIQDGSFEYPHVSIKNAIDHVQRLRIQNVFLNRQMTIKLFPTYYFLNSNRLRSYHSYLRITTMNTNETDLFEKAFMKDHIYPRLPKASMSGGILVRNWAQVTGNIYSATVSDSLFINQLFINNQRVMRSRVPMDPTEYLQYAAPLTDPNSARFGFQYVSGQFDYPSLDDAMVVVYHSWTTSHHYIDHLIPENDTVIFKNPSNLPIGTFGEQGQRRFHIENLYQALVPNSFCFVNKTKTVYLMTDGSYDPNEQESIASINEFVLIVAGDNADDPVQDVIIDNLIVQHSAWRIGFDEVADEQAAAFLQSAPVLVANATSIVISNLEVSHTGSYGIWIREGTSGILLTDSLITDTGAGGIRIGQMNAPVILPTTSVKIISNEVSYGGNVFPSGVAIISHRATEVAIVDNEIHHHRYSGISIGWQWGYDPSWTNNVLIHGNYIYNVGQHILNDQGGIYMLGLQPGSVISGNVIKNVHSYAVYMWGIYLDEGSSGIVVTNNIVYNTGWASIFQHYGANNTIINNVFARAALNPAPQTGDEQPDGDLRVQKAENHISWTFTRNIVYDTYRDDNHTAYTSDPGVTALFDQNIYYNVNGKNLLFGSDHLSFEQWQKTGQDNNSMITDPLFIGDTNQCDFFTIRSDSPAAKLGFRNLTKLSRWTPGCDTDEFQKTKQYYYWF